MESLLVKAANDALADAGIEAGDVEEIVLGHFNAGFSAQDFTAALVLQGQSGAALQASQSGLGSKTPARPAPPPSIRACGRSISGLYASSSSSA